MHRSSLIELDHNIDIPSLKLNKWEGFDSKSFSEDPNLSHCRSGIFYVF